MSDQLYRKVMLPSGRVRYEPVSEWFSGNPADGLWIVRRNGQSMTWLTEHVADTPPTADIAWIASKIDLIVDAMQTGYAQHGTAYDAARAVITALMEASNEDHT
jgi:hypothetical protein